jgi:phosphatidylglycerophosphatase A
MPQATPHRPTIGFLFSHPAHFIAMGFGSGLPRIAPGTVGTLWAWAAFVVMQLWLTPAAIGWVILASLPIGWWACSVTARDMGVADPGSIVWDEVIAFWIVLWLVTPAGLLAQVIAFGLFRYFDAAKPGPVAWADGLFKQRDASHVRWWRAAARCWSLRSGAHGEELHGTVLAVELSCRPGHARAGGGHR